MSWVLLAALVVPFVTAALTLFTGHRSDVAAKGISVGGSAHVNVDELVIRPRAQAAQHKVHRVFED